MATRPASDVAFGPLTVHLPDESDATFWFMHDLAGLFALERNADAQERLRVALRAVKVRGVDLDHEADYVFVHAKTAAGMTAVLGVMVELSPEAFEGVSLASVEAALRAWVRPKPRAYEENDIFAVPLDESRFGAIQVIAFPNATKNARGFPLVVALDAPPATLEDVRASIEAGAGAAIAARSIDDREILTGEWPKLLNRPAMGVDVAALSEREKARTGPVRPILQACLGVEPWETFEPNDHEPYLLPGAVARRRVQRRAVFEHRLREVFEADPPRARAGAATLHVVIAYRGGGREVPVLEMPKLRTIRRALSALEPAGTPDDERCAGGGYDGFFDVFVHVADVRLALERLDEVARSMKIERDLYVEAYPPFAFDWRGALRRT